MVFGEDSYVEYIHPYIYHSIAMESMAIYVVQIRVCVDTITLGYVWIQHTRDECESNTYAPGVDRGQPGLHTTPGQTLGHTSRPMFNNNVQCKLHNVHRCCDMRC